MSIKREDLLRRIEMKDLESTENASRWIKKTFNVACVANPNGFNKGELGNYIICRMYPHQLNQFITGFDKDIRSVTSFEMPEYNGGKI